MQYGMMCRVKFEKKKKNPHISFSSQIHNIDSLGMVFYYNLGEVKHTLGGQIQKQYL